MHAPLEAHYLKTVAAHFQRSINLTYDAGNTEYIAGYIPTPNGAKALAMILGNSIEDKQQRAHVWHAAYGSGKSLLAVVLAALASNDDDRTIQVTLDMVMERLARAFPAEADPLHAFRNSEKRLLPVLLSGNEGPLSLALPRALAHTLEQAGLADLRPRSQFQAALDMIALWERTYPEVYHRLDERLMTEKVALPDLLSRLETMDPTALELFERLYPGLTAGARFDRYAGQSLTDAFHTTAKALQDVGYDGIIIIWDEFGRFIESKVGEAFGPEAALLQTFAEFCNRSGDHQVHLVLTTHRLLSGYAADLPETYRQEWARIAERFVAHNVASDPLVTYRLIAEALVPADGYAWRLFAERYQDTFKELTARALELTLFEDLDDSVLRQQIIERVWPLHPLTVYALPRLSNRVAQNERTLFTFLAAEEAGTLTEYLARPTYGWETVGLDMVWDYFAEATRLDAGPGGAHPIWSGVMYGLSKIAQDDPQAMAQAIVKALGVLLIIGEANVQTQGVQGRVVPTTELIAWGLNREPDQVEAWLETLARRRAVVFRRADGYWSFTRGSDVDLETEVAALSEQRTPTRLQMRQLLERDVPLAFHLPRSYNQEKRMTRFFWCLYRWPDEVAGTGSEAFLKQLGPGGYADGAVVYILTINQAERDIVLETMHTLANDRVVYVVPQRPLLIMEPLQELLALYDLKNDATFMAQDERLPREIDFFIEDARRRLTRTLRPLNRPTSADTEWWWFDGAGWRQARIRSEGDVSRLLSRLSNRRFARTPILNNESLNQQKPTKQQTRAAEKVIDALFSQPDGEFPPNLGLVGYGPDFLIFRTLLVRPHLLQAVETNATEQTEAKTTAEIAWRLKSPEENEPLAPIWNEVDRFIKSALENEQEVAELIDTLLAPPYGLRRGVLPVLLAAMLHSRLHVLTVRQNRRVISPLTGQVLTEIAHKPEQFTFEVGPWDPQRAILWEVLQDQFHSFVGLHEREQQSLSYLSLALLRWLQAQPRFCRDTNQISAEAQQLRSLIRKAQRDPAHVLLYDLLDLLDDGSHDLSDREGYKAALRSRLNQLLEEITTAYQALLHQLDTFAENHFAVEAVIRRRDGYTILNAWLDELEKQSKQSLETFRFSDVVVERLVTTIRQEEEGRFWDKLSHAVIGLYLHDWNDRSIDTFKKNLREAKNRLQREILDLSDDEEVIELSVTTPDETSQTYRFRSSDLSPHGKRIFQNFVSTLEIAGRPLSPDEKRQVVLALLHHVMDTDKPDDRKSTRRQK